MSGKKPEYRVRIGSVVGGVWKNEADGGRIFHTANVQRMYRDGDETKYSDSFSLGDLANVQRVLTLLQEYMEAQEAVVRE